MKLIALARLALFLALIYALGEAIGWRNIQGFIYVMISPWIELFDKHDIDLHAVLLHPISLIIGAIIVLGVITKGRENR